MCSGDERREIDPRWGRADRVVIADVEDGAAIGWREFEVAWGALRDAAQTVARDVSLHATIENSQRKLAVDAQGRLSLVYVRPVGGQDRVFLGESTDGGRSWRSADISEARRSLG